MMGEKEQQEQPTNFAIYEMLKGVQNSVQTMQGQLTLCVTEIKQHSETLYGSQQHPESGLVVKEQNAEKRISLIMKVAFALVPGTGTVWLIVLWAAQFLKLVKP